MDGYGFICFIKTIFNKLPTFKVQLSTDTKNTFTLRLLTI